MTEKHQKIDTGIESGSDFILDASEMSQWHTLVSEAEKDYGCELNETMQSYLVFTLMRFARDQQLNSGVIAIDFLSSLKLPHSLRNEQLRLIGDQCLLVSGLYPRSAERRQVSVDYYVNIGRSAYHHISTVTHRTIAELYRQLTESFILLMDLLQTIRQFSTPALQPIAAMELWQETGSQAARNQVSTTSLPIHESLIKDIKKQ